jgi:ParB-like chromosome segregation protein Spo0J
MSFAHAAASSDFDPPHRRLRPRLPPAKGRLGERWQRLAAARHRGEALPPIDVFRVGELHFVVDGHHRVSVARAMGDTTIDARLREVRTRVAAERGLITREELARSALGG